MFLFSISIPIPIPNSGLNNTNTYFNTICFFSKSIPIPIPNSGPIDIPILHIFIVYIDTNTNTHVWLERYQYPHLYLNDTNTHIWAWMISIPRHFSVLFSLYALYCRKGVKELIIYKQ